MVGSPFRRKAPPYAAALLSLSLLILFATYLPVLLTQGGRVLLRGDFVTQQIPFMLEAKRCLLSGTPFWSWNTFLGANFIGTYSFYVYGSPFFWPLLAVPDAWFLHGVTAMFFLKHVTAALGAYLYLARHLENRWYAVAGGLLYAFSFFTLDSTLYYHFLDVIALFPFLLLTLDRVLDRRRGAVPLFILAVFLQAVTNYYFFAAVSIFFLIYLVIKARWGGGERSLKLGACLRAVLLYGCGALLASFLLLPSALTLLETSKATEAFSSWYKLLGLIPQIPLLIKGLILPHEGIANSGLYFMYQYCSNTAFLPLFGALLAAAGLRRWPGEWENRLVRFLVILSLVPLGNGVFSLFSNVFYTRWWFMLVLMLALVSLRTIERMNRLETVEARRIYAQSARFLAKLLPWIILPFLALRAFFLLFGGEWCPGWLQGLVEFCRADKPFDSTDWKFFLLLLALAAFNFVPLFVCIRRDSLRRAARLALVAAGVCLLNGSAYILVGEGLLGGKDHIAPGARVENAAPQPGDEALPGVRYAFRTDTLSGTDNAAMLLNRPGLRTFHSFKSKATTAFGRRIGYDITHLPTTGRYFDTPAIHALLGVRECLTTGEPPPGAPSEASGRWHAYACPDYVPMGYAYEYYVLDNSPTPARALKDTGKNNEAIERMVKACVLDSRTAEALRGVVAPCPSERLEAPWRQAAEDNRENAVTAFSADPSGFTAAASGDRTRLIYFSVPHDNGWIAYVNGEETPIYTVNYGMMGIVVPPGQEVRIEFRFRPPGLRAGAGLTLLTGAGLAAAGLAWLVRAGRKARGGLACCAESGYTERKKPGR